MTDKPTELAYKVNDGSGSDGVVVRRSSYPCCRLSLPIADRRVEPEDMIRHTMGEDLKVGCCLTWGPCFDYQKRFFTGRIRDVEIPIILRYDVEVSRFGSHMSSHLNLLNLSQQIYPGGESKDHWPTLGPSTLRWAKRGGLWSGPLSDRLDDDGSRLPGAEGKMAPIVCLTSIFQRTTALEPMNLL